MRVHNDEKEICSFLRNDFKTRLCVSNSAFDSDLETSFTILIKVVYCLLNHSKIHQTDQALKSNEEIIHRQDRPLGERVKFTLSRHDFCNIEN